MLSSIDSCQNRVSADQYHMTILQTQVLYHRGCVFLKLSTDKLPVFNLLQAQLQLVFFTTVTKFIDTVNYKFIYGSLAKSIYYCFVFSREMFGFVWS